MYIFIDIKNNSVISFKLALVVYTAEYYDIKESNVSFVIMLIDRSVLSIHTLVAGSSAVGSISCDSMQPVNIKCMCINYVIHHFFLISGDQ